MADRDGVVVVVGWVFVFESKARTSLGLGWASQTRPDQRPGPKTQLDPRTGRTAKTEIGSRGRTQTEAARKTLNAIKQRRPPPANGSSF